MRNTINWKYQQPGPKFKEIPEGLYQIKIRGVEPRPDTSGSKNDYVKFVYEVDGQESLAVSYLTFNRKDPGKTNYVITLMARCFGVELDDINFRDFSVWLGKVGTGIVARNGRYCENRVFRFVLPEDLHRRPPRNDDYVIWDEVL